MYLGPEYTQYDLNRISICFWQLLDIMTMCQCLAQLKESLAYSRFLCKVFEPNRSSPNWWFQVTLIKKELPALQLPEMIPSMSPSCKKCQKWSFLFDSSNHQVGSTDPTRQTSWEVFSGSYLSLSTPHLGIQSSWLQPLHAWRNFCWLSRPISLQLPQLAIQDSSSKPYLLEISQAESEAGKCKKMCFLLSFGRFVRGSLFDRMDLHSVLGE